MKNECFAGQLAFPNEVCRLLGHILTRNAPVRRGYCLGPAAATDKRTCSFGSRDAWAHHAVACLGVRCGDPVAVARRWISTGLCSEGRCHGRTSRISRAPISRLAGLLLRQKLRLLQADVMLTEGASDSLALVQVRRCGRNWNVIFASHVLYFCLDISSYFHLILLNQVKRSPTLKCLN